MTARRVLRQVAALALLLGILAAPMLAAPTPAAALAVSTAAANVVAAPTPGTDCLEPPMPQTPRGPFAGWLDEGPATPKEGDPFDPSSGVGLYEVYGYGGYRAVRFDPGCGWSWDPDNEMANGLTDWSLTVTGLAVFATRTIMSGDLGSVWDPVQKRMTDALGSGLYFPLISLAVMCTSIYFMASAKDADPAKAASGSLNTAAWLGIAAAAMAGVFVFGPTIDRGISAAFEAAAVMSGAQETTADGRTRATEEAVADAILRNVMYPTWQRQTFGDADAIAEEYGPRLFAAGAFTRAEYRSITPTTPDELAAAADTADKSPLDQARARQAGTDQGDRARKLIDAKQAEYKKLAEEIKQKSPTAYETLKGGDTRTRSQHSILAILSVGAALAILLYALFRVLYATTAVRIGVGLLLVVALIAQYPPTRETGYRLLRWLVNVTLQAVAWGVVFFLYLFLIVGSVMESNVHPVWKTVMLLIVTTVIYAVAKMYGLASGGPLSAAIGAAKRKAPRVPRWRGTRDTGHPQHPGHPQRPGRPGRGIATTDQAAGTGSAGHARTGSMPRSGGAGNRGQRVPGMGNLYGGPTIDLGHLRTAGRSTPSAASKATVHGQVIHTSPQAQRGLDAAMRAASLPRGTPGGLAARPGGPTPAQQAETDRALTIARPVVDKARREEARAQIAATSAARRRDTEAATAKLRARLYRPTPSTRAGARP